MGELILLLALLADLPVFAEAAKPLLFLGDRNYPPVAYLENGEARGMDVDLARALGVAMKREIRVELIDWNLAQEKVLRGEADALLGLSITEDRRASYDFAEPAFPHEFSLVVRKNEVTIRSVDDLRGKKVGATAGGFPRGYLARNPGIELVLIADYADGFHQLVAGKVDAIASDRWVAAFMIEREGFDGLSILGQVFATAQGAIAVRKGNKALLDDVNKATETLRHDGTIQKIQENWRPQEVVFASRQRVRNLIATSAGIFAGVLLVFMSAWIFTLKRQIRIRWNAESASRESEERFRNLTAAAFEGVCVSEGGRILDCNDQMLEMFGYHVREELIGKEILELIAPESRELVSEAVRTNRESIYGHSLRRKDGTVFYGEARARMVRTGGRVLRMTALRDITERKRTEQALRESEEKFAVAFKAGPDIMSIAELESGRYIEVNGVHEQMFGFKREEVIGRSPSELGLLLDPSAHERLVESLRANSRVRDMEVPVRSRDGVELTMLVSAELIQLGGQNCVLRVAHDITEQKRSEKALRESERRFRGYFELPIIGLATTSLDRKFLAVNDQLCQTLGYTREELMQKSWMELTHPEDRTKDADQFRQMLAGELDVFSMEKRYIRKNGAVIEATISVRCVRRGNGSPDYFIGLLQDITDRKQAERERAEILQREQKALEDYTRQLIASQEAERRRIAGELHDSLGQNLLLIKNRVQQVLGSGLLLNEPREQLEAASQLASEAIAEVRNISRDLRPYQLDQLGLTRALAALIETTAESTGISIKHKLDKTDDVFDSDDATGIYRIVQESLTNILKHSGAKSARVELERDVRHVTLWVKDDGRGFGPGRGGARDTGGGLGLRNIAERARILGGSLKIHSAPGEGVSVEVVIPVEA